MEILKENFVPYKVFRVYYQKLMNRTEIWVVHNIWPLLEQFGHLLALSNVMLFIIMKTSMKTWIYWKNCKKKVLDSDIIMWIGSIMAVECGVQTQYSYSEKKYRSKYQLLHGLCVTNWFKNLKIRQRGYQPSQVPVICQAGVTANWLSEKMPTLTLEGPVEEREIALNFFRQIIPNNSILLPKIELCGSSLCNMNCVLNLPRADYE